MHACIQIQALHQTFKMETNQSITQLHRSILWSNKKRESHLINDQLFHSPNNGQHLYWLDLPFLCFDFVFSVTMLRSCSTIFSSNCDTNASLLKQELKGYENTLPATARDACGWHPPLVVACFLDLKTEAGSTVWEPQHTISMCVRTWPSAHQAMLTYPIAEEHTDSSIRANYLFSPRE